MEQALQNVLYERYWRLVLIIWRAPQK